MAILVDVSTGQTLFAREADRRFMPASITKAMTALTAFEMIEQGRLFPRQIYTVRPETFRQWQQVGSTMFLPADAQVSVDDLLRGITTVSANDASVVLAEGAAGSVAEWTAAMNAAARTIGMTDSHFNTPNGWMDEGRTFTTARDLAALGTALAVRHPAKYRRYFGASEFTYNGITQPNHDPIIGVVPGADGIKTGFTNQAGYGFLGSAQRGSRRLVMVIAGAPSARSRNRAARDLVEWGFAEFAYRRLFEAGEQVGNARVQGGSVRHVGLVSKGPVRLSLPKDGPADVELAIRYSGPLIAPIAAGEQVASLVVTMNGQEVADHPLYAEVSVGRTWLLGRAINGVLGWFS